LKKHNAKHTFAISGDVHFSELSKTDIGGYPFYDLTSSGMTHTSTIRTYTKNSFRIGKPSFHKNAGMIEIDWIKKSLKLESFNVGGKPLIQHLIPFKELAFKK
jgi:alkaline phosphatase D